MKAVLGVPDFVTLFTADEKCVFNTDRTMCFNDVEIEITQTSAGVKIQLAADKTPVEYLRLRWNRSIPCTARFLGDAWERSYGELQWRTYDASRLMPWYFFMKNGDEFSGYGVKVRPSSMAQWSADAEGVTLWLDLRCGTLGVILNGRRICAAETVSMSCAGADEFSAAHEFCKMMCDAPLPVPYPVYGGNNWYYAYGRSSHEEIVADSRYIASLCEGLENRPFMVIDDGWQVMHMKPGNSGPWTGGNSKYPDMKRLAAEMRESKVRPGIWFRPLWNLDPAIPQEWLMAERHHSGHRALDPSVPEVLELVKTDIRRISGWGFELIKHDFSTWDMFGLWGRDIVWWLANATDDSIQWSFADRSRTSAEIVVDFYKAVLEAAGDTLILGCNTIGHLGAGLMHLARIGDDTSGKAWDRTRKMGVNTLAFRLCQHRAFFDIDADCIGVTGLIDWSQNRQWGELLAKSGTPLFASIKPGVLSAAEFEEMKQFFAIASKQKISAEPVDWLNNPTPAIWKMDKETKNFNWYEAAGAAPDFITVY